MPLLFAVTLFVSAFLLFLVQPMIGKMILPRLGGTPAVWNTCMLFFQAALLAGYGYTHSVSTYLPVRRQLFVHGGLLLLPLLLLVILGPFSIGFWEPPPEANPIFAVLVLLTVVVGVPFFVVATSAPLLQKWFASTGHASAKDPYYLYGASNLGSMLALIAYPVWVEQGFDLDHQSTLWMFGYGAFFLCTVLCGLAVWAAPPHVQLAGVPKTDATPAPMEGGMALPPVERTTAVERNVKQGRGRKLRLATPASLAPAAAKTAGTDADAIDAWRRLRWVALAAVPSSLMLGVTTFITTDIAAVPFFWVVPLALYLLSFILVFMRWPVQWLGLPHRLVLWLQPLALVLVALVSLLSRITPTWLLLFAHTLAFFLTALMCHGELARDRPSTRKLTEFYLWMSVGGVVGGLFNALIAPVVFQRSHVEYPLVLVMACALRPPLTVFNRWFGFDREGNGLQEYLLDVGYAICLGLFHFALLRIAMSQNIWGEGKSFEDFLARVAGGAGLNATSAGRVGIVLGAAVTYGLPVLICIGFAGRPLRFGLGLLALITVAHVVPLMTDNSTLYAGRSFFGLRRVELDDRGNGVSYHVLIHGVINHGAQRVTPEADRNDPITYFHPKGPIGELFTHFKQNESARAPEERRPFGVVGLGIGTLASYGLNGQHVVFYEIDPAVRDLSLPPEGRPTYFYYLQDAKKRGVKVEVDIGDGRLRLREAPDHYYQILVLDAFSSDAIPVHLLTMEALDLYLQKLAPGGVIIYNVTNNYVNLPPVLADQALAKGLICLHRGDVHDRAIPEKYAADWVILAPKDPGPLARSVARWVTAPPLAQLALGSELTQILTHRHPDWPLLLRQLGLKSAAHKRGWEELSGDPQHRVWRDNYTNLLGAMTWDR